MAKQKTQTKQAKKLVKGVEVKWRRVDEETWQNVENVLKSISRNSCSAPHILGAPDYRLGCINGLVDATLKRYFQEEQPKA